MFHGASSHPCRRMMPIVDKLIKDGMSIEKKEVLTNSKNAKQMKTFNGIIVDAWGNNADIPIFIDTNKKRAICGEQGYFALRNWMNR